MKIALLGAESTGKTELAGHLAKHFAATTRVVQVSEYLREWCDTQQRTPKIQEQVAIAQEQARRVDQVPACDWLIADTTPLMTAVYSDFLFNDARLYAMALAHQRSFDVTLLMGLDMPWVADGLQRDGSHVREAVDALIRAALQGANIPYQVVYGMGDARLNHALRCIQTPLPGHNLPSTDSIAAQKTAAWAWTCERCSDPGCEHRLLTRLLTH